MTTTESNALAVLENSPPPEVMGIYHPKVRTTWLEVAELQYKSGMLPKHINNSHALLYLYSRGISLGMDPSRFAEQTYMINGVLGYKIPLIKALLANHGVRWEMIEKTDKVCKIKFSRDGWADHTEVFDESDWQAMDLRNNATWKRTPKQMVEAQAMRRGAMFIAPDILGGIAYDDESAPPVPGSNAVVVSEPVARAELTEGTSAKKNGPGRPRRSGNDAEGHASNISNVIEGVEDDTGDAAATSNRVQPGGNPTPARPAPLASGAGAAQGPNGTQAPGNSNKSPENGSSQTIVRAPLGAGGSTGQRADGPGIEPAHTGNGREVPIGNQPENSGAIRNDDGVDAKSVENDAGGAATEPGNPPDAHEGGSDGGGDGGSSEHFIAKNPEHRKWIIMVFNKLEIPARWRNVHGDAIREYLEKERVPTHSFLGESAVKTAFEKWGV